MVYLEGIMSFSHQLKTWLVKIEWVNFWFMFATPVIAVAGTIWTLNRNGSHALTWVLFGVLMMATGLGITVGYHRLMSHRTFKGNAFVRMIFLLLGGAAFEGSAREWCSAHRKHHRFVDTDKDPYNIKKGFWHAHMGWVIFKSDQSDESGIPDLLRDPVVIFQNRFYVPLAIVVSFILPTLLATLWGDLWGGLFIAGFLRMVINLQFTFLINSYAHYFGKQMYSDATTARDSWVLALLTYGEGFHSYHHAFESDYRNGVRPYHYDPAKWVISLLSKIGWAWDLKRTPKQKILAARLAMEQKRFEYQMNWDLKRGGLYCKTNGHF